MTATLIATHRRDLAALVRLAVGDLGVVWRTVDTPAAARDTMLELLPQLADVYGSAAATLGADWYDEMRDAAEVPGRFRAVPADLPDRGRTDSLARWAVGPLFQATPDYTSARTLVEGGFQRLIADADRGSVARSAVADPGARGWQRAGDGSCTFCSMLIARGAVYSEASADFASHDHCNCVATPAFINRPVPVKPYTPSERNSTPADRARVRAYLATH